MVGNTVTYAPNANASIDYSETLTYTVSDGTATDTGTLTITVTAANDAPVAVDDTETILEDAGLTNITVLDDDTDADGDSLTLSSVSLDDSSLGTVAINGDNTTIDFTPAADANGTATVTYTVSDGTTTDTGNLVITITAVDDGPTAFDDSATTGANSTLIINVTANDIEPDGTALTITAISTPSNGTVTTDGATITYVPSTDFSGTDSFSYEISDGVSVDSATVTVTVLKENVGACDPSAADLSTLTDGCKVSPTGYKTSVYSFGLCSSPPTAPDTGTAYDLSNCSLMYDGAATDSPVDILFGGVNDRSTFSGTMTIPEYGDYSYGVLVIDNSIQMKGEITLTGSGSDLYCVTDSNSATLVTCSTSYQAPEFVTDAIEYLFDTTTFSYNFSEDNVTVYLVDSAGMQISNTANADKIVAIQQLPSTVTFSADTTKIDIGIRISDGLMVNSSSSELESSPFSITFTVD